MNWLKKSNVLFLETGKAITFDSHIKRVDEYDAQLMVRLDVNSRNPTVKNSFYISKKDGTITWGGVGGTPPCSESLKAKYSRDYQAVEMNWGKDGNVLLLDNDKRVNLDYAIESILEESGIIVVALEVPPEESMTENVYGVNKDGQIVWQIERIAATASDPINRYTGLSVTSVPEIAVACNWNCTNVYIDVKTGKVLDAQFTK